ncbi:uncharacterized protein EpC_08170 [Erwinia pyrifoliae Ep1/96]|nr:hypothetical protein CPI84_14775 [Erwinia pyrifoliae]MCA8876077.1 hypothetical protein [Erwinia pyrifoliae]CAX54596.1 uncharacterized protein EpC_08170 [Erwinia pyrifoliae Ep1/96]
MKKTYKLYFLINDKFFNFSHAYIYSSYHNELSEFKMSDAFTVTLQKLRIYLEEQKRYWRKDY